jgi:glyoxylase-like metal-dependent hydrolase (beta-lactamase superfamily II)
VWLSEGLSNSYLVVTGEGRVIVNTGMGHEAAVHKELFDAVDDAPVRYILLTQGHVDHVGGVDWFREAGTVVVAQQANAACQADDARIAAFRIRRSWPFWADAIAKATDATRRPAASRQPQQSRPVADVTFEDHYAFELGGSRFELLSTPGGETLDSAVVWLPERRIAFVGNLFSALFGHFPNLVTIRGDRPRSALAFIESANRVLTLEPELLCTGHFEPIEGAETIRSEIERVRDAVQYVHDAVVAGMNEGADVETLMAEIRLPDHLEVGEGYGKVSWGVRAIWEGYAGWFHARSTTELYPVRPDDAYPAVVALAGADALVEASGREVATGHSERALHLAEMVLTADPGHRGALEASRSAHRALLARADGENFWEVGWLRHRIAELDRVLDPP